MKLQKVYFLSLLMLSGFSCTKGGTGGSGSIAVVAVQHNGKDLTEAHVFFEYGTKEFPGTDLSRYDANGRFTKIGVNRAIFHNLTSGYYYLYAISSDGTGKELKGPLSVRIRRGESKEVVIPVFE
jgi:hypothetical protein